MVQLCHPTMVLSETILDGRALIYLLVLLINSAHFLEKKRSIMPPCFLRGYHTVIMKSVGRKQGMRNTPTSHRWSIPQMETEIHFLVCLTRIFLNPTFCDYRMCASLTHGLRRSTAEGSGLIFTPRLTI